MTRDKWAVLGLAGVAILGLLVNEGIYLATHSAVKTERGTVSCDAEGNLTISNFNFELSPDDVYTPRVKINCLPDFDWRHPLATTLIIGHFAVDGDDDPTAREVRLR